MNPIAVGRTRLSACKPYLSRALYAMVPVATDDLPPGVPAAIDAGWRIYYSEATIAEQGWAEADLEMLCYHEVLHLLRDHCARARRIEAVPLPWNVCADCEINDDVFADFDLDGELYSMPRKIREGVCEAGKFGWPDGLLAEEYYRRLREKPWLSTQSKCGEPNDGSGVHGRAELWEQGHHEGDQDESVSGGLTPEEADCLREQVVADIKDHLGRMPGSVPGHLVRWAKRLRPSVDWKRQLGHRMRAALADSSGRLDYTYRRPSRRHADGDCVMPSLAGPRSRVAVVVDVSGSMWGPRADQAIAEARKIASAAGRETVVYHADVGITGRFRGGSSLRASGGGGTDMADVMAHAAKSRPRPDAIVVLTDCLTAWPKVWRGPPVVVGRVGNDASSPPWARTVQVKLTLDQGERD